VSQTLCPDTSLNARPRQVINIYTDSWYAFARVHVHGAIYKKRGLLTAVGKTIKNTEAILHLLDAIWLPKEVDVLHCRDTIREMTQ
jgi:hypothetical protein